MELFHGTNNGNWKLEKRISGGASGNPGSLFKDESGAWHFIPDL
jgi:hypothetical protein